MPLTSDIENNKRARKLDIASGVFLFVGSALDKLKYLPIPAVNHIVRAISLSASLVGFLLGMLAASLYPNHPPSTGKWYGFGEFKEQYGTAAIIGAIGVIIGFIGIAVPPLFVLAAWFLAISDIIGAIGDYHKWKNPPCDPAYSSTRQEALFYFSFLSTIAAIVASSAAMAAFFFPSALSIIMAISLPFCLIFGGAALICWGYSVFGDHTPDEYALFTQQANSYVSILETCPPQPSYEKPALPKQTCATNVADTIYQPLFPQAPLTKPLSAPKNGMTPVPNPSF